MPDGFVSEHKTPLRLSSGSQSPGHHICARQESEDGWFFVGQRVREHDLDHQMWSEGRCGYRGRNHLGSLARGRRRQYRSGKLQTDVRTMEQFGLV